VPWRVVVVVAAAAAVSVEPEVERLPDYGVQGVHVDDLNVRQRGLI